MTNSFGAVVCGLLIGVNLVITAFTYLDVANGRPEPESCPPPPECKKPTPDEYRDELVRAGKQLGWVCHPHLEVGETR